MGWTLKYHNRANARAEVKEDADKSTIRSAGLVGVEVTVPHVGGIDRICVQAGTLEPFEAADLYAKVSGFLIEQSVDIGSRVKKGQLLAKLSVPEFDKQILRETADVLHAKAKMRQMETHVTAIQAEAKAAKAMIVLSEAQLRSKSSYRSFRQKQLNRMKELSEKNAIDARTVDEAEDHYESALSAEEAAKEAITTSRLKYDAAEANVLTARADLDEAKAEVQVIEADLGKAQVMLSYTQIVSPYDGVVTKRSYSRGDFIRSADSGGDRVPLFAVERTDKMRVVVQVPDRDVPYTNIGDKAKIEIDALPGKIIDSAISRLAESEDAATRSMRTEIDIPNPDGRLRRGMYGRATLLLESGHPENLTVPSSALQGKSEGHRAILRVVRQGVVHVIPVVTGADTGVQVEILSGLKREDQVILRASGPIEEGTVVSVNGAH